jgi:hypothetical protein
MREEDRGVLGRWQAGGSQGQRARQMKTGEWSKESGSDPYLASYALAQQQWQMARQAERARPRRTSKAGALAVLRSRPSPPYVLLLLSLSLSLSSRKF